MFGGWLPTVMAFNFNELKFPDGVPIHRVAAYGEVLARLAGELLAVDKLCCWEDLTDVVDSGGWFHTREQWHARAANAVGVEFPPGDHRRQSAEAVAAEHVFSRDLVGVRTHCLTGAESTVQLKGMLHRSPTGLWLHLIAGSVCGFESAPFGLVQRHIADQECAGWTACVGTEGRWDRLVVTADSLRAAYGSTNPEPPAGLPYLRA